MHRMSQHPEGVAYVVKLGLEVIMRCRRVLVLLFTCICFTAIIRFDVLGAEPQKGPITPQPFASSDAKMQEQKLQLDRDRLEFEKTKHQDEMRVKLDES